MPDLDLFTSWVLATYARLRGRASDHGADRGDVPGWVMVTIMTAGLVVVIFTAFKGEIQDAIHNAIQTVTDGT
jgi:hypothetical protein